jgi:uncharacterized protein (TIGR02145 family)
MKKNNLILGVFFAITAIFLSGCGESGSLVTIGTQVWTTKNLDVATFRNGDNIPEAKSDADWFFAGNNMQAAWCYYGYDVANGTKYGKLYNWYAVNDPRGLAPNGYHIPTDEEWTKLTDYLGNESAGTKMKNTSGWYNPTGNGNNSSGFSALPGGEKGFHFDFFGIESMGSWWSSSMDENSYFKNPWSRELNSSEGRVKRLAIHENCGFSVRCLKD